MNFDGKKVMSTYTRGNCEATSVSTVKDDILTTVRTHNHHSIQQLLGLQFCVNILVVKNKPIHVWVSISDSLIRATVNPCLSEVVLKELWKHGFLHLRNACICKYIFIFSHGCICK